MSFTIACDLKMANILAGLMSHASAHPCTWCCAKREHLGRPGLSRTLTDNEENYNRWLREGGDSKKAKFFSTASTYHLSNQDMEMKIY